MRGIKNSKEISNYVYLTQTSKLLSAKEKFNIYLHDKLTTVAQTLFSIY